MTNWVLTLDQLLPGHYYYLVGVPFLLRIQLVRVFSHITQTDRANQQTVYSKQMPSAVKLSDSSTSVAID